jgi:hypothetical protein
MRNLIHRRNRLDLITKTRVWSNFGAYFCIPPKYISNEQIIVGGFGTYTGRSYMCLCAHCSFYVFYVMDFKITLCRITICWYLCSKPHKTGYSQLSVRVAMEVQILLLKSTSATWRHFCNYPCKNLRLSMWLITYHDAHTYGREEVWSVTGLR